MNSEQFQSTSQRDRRGDPGLFTKLRTLSVSRLRAVLVAVLAKADDTLYELAQQDEVSFGSKNLEALRALRQSATPLEQAFVRHLESRFDTLQRKLQVNAGRTEELSLVEIDAMEDLVASELIAEAIGRVHGANLEIIENRLANLVGVESLSPADNPISAAVISNAVRVALNDLALTPNIRVLLFKNYEREVIAQLGPLIDEINAMLAAAGILPELGKPRVAATVQAQRPPPTPSEFTNPATYAGDQVHTAPAGAGPLSEGDDKALFDALCSMLHSWRPQAGEGARGGDGHADAGQDQSRRPLAIGEMISVLSLLQQSVPSTVTEALNHPEASLAGLLKQEMLRSAGQIGLPPEKIKMSRDDEDAVDLVGMLFDVLFDERDFEMQARTLISRLVVPYVKAAVMDRRLFQYKTHPARRLLNSLSEAVEGNKGEGPQERELLQKAETTVDRLVAEFNEDIAIFETLEQELRAFLEQHHRRIELAERRATEAQRGQERLEQARTLAAAELNRRIENRVMPPALEDFLTRSWSHHLSMISLREGPDSATWNAALGVADSLIDLLPQAGRPARPAGPALHNLREPIENVLASSGITGEAAYETIRGLAANIDAIQQVVVQSKVDKPPVAAVVSINEARPGLSVVSDKDRFDYNEEDLPVLRGLRVGSWVDLAGDDGKLHPAKMSWVSPISSRLMFVNRRGVRILVASAEELAAMKKQGKLVLREQAQVFDQALHRVMGRLQGDIA